MPDAKPPERHAFDRPAAPQRKPPATRTLTRSERSAKRPDELRQRVARQGAAHDDDLAPRHPHPQQQRVLSDEVGEHGGAAVGGARQELPTFGGEVPAWAGFPRRPAHQVQECLRPAALCRRQRSPGARLRTHAAHAVRPCEPRQRPVLVELDVLLGEAQAVSVAAGETADLSPRS